MNTFFEKYAKREVSNQNFSLPLQHKTLITMQFFTQVTIPTSSWQIAYTDKILMLGSCFTDNIAGKMRQHFLQVTANPFGTLYNPVSIARHIPDLLTRETDVVVITFGTAWVYVDKQTNKVVDNCLKRPANDFNRRRLTIDEIVSLWQPIVSRYADTRFIFTVSPIRHIKDGLHENQVSKGILLQAVDQIVSLNTERIHYFPAYEIVLDELRDYRFYASDMLHPSTTAVDYIWERLVSTYMTDRQTQNAMRELHQLWLYLKHRPIHPDSEETRLFETKTQERKELLSRTYPWIKEYF